MIELFLGTIAVNLFAGAITGFAFRIIGVKFGPVWYFLIFPFLSAVFGVLVSAMFGMHINYSPSPFIPMCGGITWLPIVSFTLGAILATRFRKKEDEKSVPEQHSTIASSTAPFAAIEESLSPGRQRSWRPSEQRDVKRIPGKYTVWVFHDRPNSSGRYWRVFKRNLTESEAETLKEDIMEERDSVASSPGVGSWDYMPRVEDSGKEPNNYELPGTSFSYPTFRTR